MSYCPKCKKEYEGNLELCRDCGTKLVESLDDESDETNDKEAFLINAADEMYANILISKLSAFGIPVMKKYSEAGIPEILGNSHLGIGLYVPSRLLSNAKDIIKEENLSDDEAEFDSMLNDFGFEDIDNMDFNENEPEKSAVKQLNIENTFTDKPKDSISKGKSRCNKNGQPCKNMNSSTRVIALIMLIILGVTLIYSAFQLIGKILGLL